MIRGYVLMWTAGYLVFTQPVGVQRPQNAQHSHRYFGTEYVINDPFKVVSAIKKRHARQRALTRQLLNSLRVVGKGHDIVLVGLYQLKRMSVLIGIALGAVRHNGGQLLETFLVGDILEIGMFHGNAPVGEVIHHARAGQRVEITTHDEWNRVGICLVTARIESKLGRSFVDKST